MWAVTCRVLFNRILRNLSCNTHFRFFWLFGWILTEIRGVHDQILAANRTPIVWEEMLLQWNVTLNKEVLVQVWQSAANIKHATSMGYKVPPPAPPPKSYSNPPVSPVITESRWTSWAFTDIDHRRFFRFLVSRLRPRPMARLWT